MTRRPWFVLAMWMTLLAAAASHRARADDATTTPSTRPAALRAVRVAAIGGINDQNFWKSIVERFESETRIRIETVATGNKDGAAELFRAGGIDLITLQSAEGVIGLVTDGWAVDAQPWVQSDLALVGPEADPAGVKGSGDLVEALRKIAKAKAPLLVHDNSGTHDVIRAATQSSGIELPAESTLFVADDHQRRVLTIASERKAYTLIGRVPFRTGKLANAGLVVMVEGDPRLRRPYLLAIASEGRFTDVRTAEARRLAEFLRSASTQKWIESYGRGVAGDAPLFYPVTAIVRPTTSAATRPTP